jgi:hypothetical protein
MPTLPDTAMAPHKAERIADESLHLVEGVFVTTPERTLGACALGSSGGCANPTQVHLADAELVNDNGTTLYQYLTGRPFQILARAEGGGLSDIVIVGLGNQTDGTCIETYGYSPTATCSLQTPR